MSRSIIIPTINARPDLLQRCVDSVTRTLNPDDQLVVIEGGTFAENCNAGAAETTGDTLIFLNDDTKIDQDDWLELLTAPFADPNIGVTGCRLIYPDGKIQHSGVYFDVADGILTAYNRTWDADSGPMPAVTGACLAIHRDLFNILHGFDIEFRNGYEDVDLCLRAAEEGFQSYYVAECTVIHHESQSGPARWEHVDHNVRRLQQLWKVTD